MRTALRTTLRSAAVAMPVIVGLTLMSSGVAGALVEIEPLVDKVQICHANSNDKDPYVLNTPSASGDAAGHADHLGPVWDAGLKAAHLSWGDIIPPFRFDSGDGILRFPGLNWSTEGQAIWNNDCLIPAVVVPPVTAVVIDPLPPVPPAEPGADGGGDAAAGVGTTDTPAPLAVVVEPPALPQEVLSSEPPVNDTAGADAVTSGPTAEPTDEPTNEPTVEPTSEPTTEPTTEPTDEPTTESTEEPTEVSTQVEQEATSGEGAPQTFTGGSGQLAFTGSPIVSYALLSLGLLVSGGLMVLLGRRRSAQ